MSWRRGTDAAQPCCAANFSKPCWNVVRQRPLLVGTSTLHTPKRCTCSTPPQHNRISHPCFDTSHTEALSLTHSATRSQCHATGIVLLSFASAGVFCCHSVHSTHRPAFRNFLEALCFLSCLHCKLGCLHQAPDQTDLGHIANFIIKEQHVPPLQPGCGPDVGQMAGVLLGRYGIKAVCCWYQLDVVKLGVKAWRSTRDDINDSRQRS